MDWPEATAEIERIRALKVKNFLDAGVREVYRKSLGRLHDLAVRHPDLALKLLEDECTSAEEHGDFLICSALAEGLVKARQPGTAPLLSRMLIDPRARAIREDLVELLGLLGDPDAGSALVAALSDPEVWVRAKAARSLGLLRYEPAAEPLVRALRDDSGSVRANAARALGRLGARQAMPALARLAQSDEDEVVRDAASDALKTLGA